jgi:hypothetical protein
MAPMRSKGNLPRIISVGVVGMIWLATVPCSFGQTKDHRLEEALVDITLLKHVVAEQGRHITALEKTIEALQVKVVADPQRSIGEDRVKIPTPAPTSPWQVPFTWNRIKDGMSRAQVVEILGQPASVDSVLDYQTLIYKGEAPGSGTVTGSVRLADNRVSQVNPPGF